VEVYNNQQPGTNVVVSPNPASVDASKYNSNIYGRDVKVDYVENNKEVPRFSNNNY